MSQNLNIWMPQEEMTLMDLRVSIDRIITREGFHLEMLQNLNPSSSLLLGQINQSTT